jgi:hypothetical protein
MLQTVADYGGREGKYCSPNSKYCGQISDTVQNRTHVHINFYLRITDTITSQNIDLSPWDMLYVVVSVVLINVETDLCL